MVACSASRIEETRLWAGRIHYSDCFLPTRSYPYRLPTSFRPEETDLILPLAFESIPANLPKCNPSRISQEFLLSSRLSTPSRRLRFRLRALHRHGSATQRYPFSTYWVVQPVKRSRYSRKDTRPPLRNASSIRWVPLGFLPYLKKPKTACALDPASLDQESFGLALSTRSFL